MQGTQRKRRCEQVEKNLCFFFTWNQMEEHISLLHFVSVVAFVVFFFFIFSFNSLLLYYRSFALYNGILEKQQQQQQEN